MLYEMTHATPNQQLELSDTLKGVRRQKFPVGFDRTNPVNKLIVKMLSGNPDKRPRTNDILQDIELLQNVKSPLKPDSQRAELQMRKVQIPLKSKSSPQKNIERLQDVEQSRSPSKSESFPLKSSLMTNTHAFDNSTPGINVRL